MPEYLAPGVYVEETSFRNKTIEGVSTSTAGFVGPTRFGPFEGEPELLTSYSDFIRIYCGIDQLEYSGAKMCNYLAFAVRAFFEEGGKRLYVARVYTPPSAEPGEDGYAKATIPDITSPPGEVLTLRMRYPGAAGNVTVTFMVKKGQNIFIREDEDKYPVMRGVSNYDTVLVEDLASPSNSTGKLYWVNRYYDETYKRWSFQLRQDNPNNNPGDTQLLKNIIEPPLQNPKICIVTVNVTIDKMGKFLSEQTWENLTFHPQHEKSLNKIFAKEPKSRSTELFVPLVFSPPKTINNGYGIANVLMAQPSLDQQSTLLEGLLKPNSSIKVRSYEILLKKGFDGVRPDAEKYKGKEYPVNGLKYGLKAFEDLEDISMVATPGSSYDYKKYESAADSIIRHLISHCERMRYRIAVLDSAEKHLISEVRSYRAKLDSKHAALYYPWITIVDPLTNDEINQPPSGYVCGIYARNDIEHGVHKSPANEVVRGAIGFGQILNKAQQDVLNPEGINCFRFFEGRGYRLWGARTITSDPEWKYVNLRRYFAYLERSIEKHTQWVVFENNSAPLWSNVSSTVEDFLYNEWKSGHLMGEKPAQSYFVRCDRSTMTQNDIDNGRLICLIGVAPVRPAEFVIFRIGQWTASRSQ